MRRFTKIEIIRILGIEEGFLVECLSQEWVRPAQCDNPDALEFDEEDLARLTFIRELTRDFGLNSEGVPVVLHLLDQIHFLRRQILKTRAALDAKSAEP